MEAKADWLRETLLPLVDVVPVCPELRMGLGVPREALRLQREGAGVALVTSRSGRDVTELALTTAESIVAELPEDLDAYVLMGRSPTCGPHHVKVYDRSGVPQPGGVGLFAQVLQQRRPDILVIEAGRLTDESQRGHFLIQLFVAARAARLPSSVAALMAFQRQHKFLLLGYGQIHLKRLGRIAAEATRATFASDRAKYLASLRDALASPPKRSAEVNALEHMYGFLKDLMTPQERVEMRRQITAYADGRASRLVPMTLINFAATVRDATYIREQAVFEPYPDQLK